VLCGDVDGMCNACSGRMFRIRLARSATRINYPTTIVAIELSEKLIGSAY